MKDIVIVIKPKAVIATCFLMGFLAVGVAAVHVPEAAAQFFCPRGMTAQSLVILDEINVLRIRAGLPLRQTNDVIQAIQFKMDTLAPFNCETNRPVR